MSERQSYWTSQAGHSTAGDATLNADTTGAAGDAAAEARRRRWLSYWLMYWVAIGCGIYAGVLIFNALSG